MRRDGVRARRRTVAAALAAVLAGGVAVASGAAPTGAQAGDPSTTAPPTTTTTAPPAPPAPGSTSPAGPTTTVAPDAPGGPATTMPPSPATTTATTAPSIGSPPPVPPGDPTARPSAPADDQRSAEPPSVQLADGVLTVEPATGLLDGMEVTARLTGLEPGAWVMLVQCATGATSAAEDCQDTSGSFEQADGAGNFTTTFRASAIVVPTVPGRPEVDCRAPGACEAWAEIWPADERPPAQSPPVALEFVPDGPLAPPPAVTVTPGTDLSDGQVVSVAATGLIWSDGVLLMQCAADPSEEFSDCEWSTQRWQDAVDGSLAADHRVYAVIETGNGTVDCRVAGACVLAVTQDNLRSSRRTAFAPLTFDPDAEIVPPTLTVTPATDHVDGQIVTVRGTGFVADFVELSICAPAATGSDDCVMTNGVSEPDANGSFTAEAELSAIVTTASGEVDCRTSEEPCVLVAASGSPTSPRAGRVELDFRPDGPVRPGPAITVTPSEDLPEIATVTVAGENFASATWDNAQVQVCRVGDFAACDDQTFSEAAPSNDGRFRIELGVAASFTVWTGETVDCRAAPGCQVVARLGWQGRRATAPLAFGPAGGPGERYLDPVFDEVEVIEDVAYRRTVDAAGQPVDLTLDIYQPVGDTAEERPAVVWLPGGWYTARDGEQADAYARAFAERGYVAVTMEYRTRPGLGCCPTDDVEGVTEAILDATADAAAGVGWLRDRAADYRIDPAAIAVGGFQGGGTAAYALAHPPDDVGGTASPAAAPVAAVLPVQGLDLGWAGGGDTPALAFHGGYDTTAPLHLSVLSCNIAARSGATCGAVGYAGVGHVGAARQRDIVFRAGNFLAETVLDPLGYLEWTGPTTAVPTGPGTPPAAGSPGSPGTPGSPGSPPAPNPVAVAVTASPVGAAVPPGLRDALPRTGADLARLLAVAVGLGVLGATLLFARHRRARAAAAGTDTGNLRMVVAAVIAAVALAVGGVVASDRISSSSDGEDESAESDDPEDSDHTDHDAMDHDAMDHDAMDHDSAAGDHEGHIDSTGEADHDHAGSGAGVHAHPAGANDHHPGPANPTDPGHHPGPANPADPGHHPGPSHPNDPGHHPVPPHPGDPNHPHEPEPPDNGFDPDWTREQVAYAQRLIDATEAQAPRFDNPALLPLLGFQWISDGQGLNQYQHWIHLTRIVDTRRLDPAYPESLVFRATPDGPVLEASMYMLGLQYTLDTIPADIAWLPDWHIHDNLCFVGNFELVGVTVNGRCLRGNVIPTPPMLHVWTVNTPCGRFAGVDEFGLQCDHDH